VAPIVFGFDKFFHAAWLAGIIVNLLLIPDFYDIALRDFGLLLAALTQLGIDRVGSQVWLGGHWFTVVGIWTR
jgi:hypothetical protein